MTTAILQLIRASKDRVLILDSNLLLLYITSLYDLRLLQKFKRIQMFTQADAILLGWVIDQFAGLATTAHVLAEVSNLANSLSYSSRNGWFETLAAFAFAVPEVSVSCKQLSELEEFWRFGVTDAALSHSSSAYIVLTNDHRLAGYLTSAGKQVLDFAAVQAMA